MRLNPSSLMNCNGHWFKLILLGIFFLIEVRRSTLTILLQISVGYRRRSMLLASPGITKRNLLFNAIGGGIAGGQSRHAWLVPLTYADQTTAKQLTLPS